MAPDTPESDVIHPGYTANEIDPSTGAYIIEQYTDPAPANASVLEESTQPLPAHQVAQHIHDNPGSKAAFLEGPHYSDTEKKIILHDLNALRIQDDLRNFEARQNQLEISTVGTAPAKVIAARKLRQQYVRGAEAIKTQEDSPDPHFLAPGDCRATTCRGGNNCYSCRFVSY